MGKRTSFNISDENDEYLNQLGGNKTDVINDLISKLRSGQIQQTVQTGDKDLNCIYNMAKLGTSEIDILCPVKGHYIDLTLPHNKEKLLKFCGKCPRHHEHMALVKLRMLYPKNYESQPEPTKEAPAPKPAADPVEKRPEIPAPQPRNPPSNSGKRIVCDTCKESFSTYMTDIDALDRLLSTFEQHLKDKHNGRLLTQNEANQFRALKVKATA